VLLDESIRTSNPVRTLIVSPLEVVSKEMISMLETSESDESYSHLNDRKLLLFKRAGDLVLEYASLRPSFPCDSLVRHRLAEFIGRYIVESYDGNDQSEKLHSVLRLCFDDSDDELTLFRLVDCFS